MASIFRRTYTKIDPATGKRRKFKAKKWYIQFRDATGKLRRVPGYTDKEATRQLAAKLERRAQRQEAGLVDPYEQFRALPLTDHLKSYQEFLTNKGNSPEYVKLTSSRIAKLFDACRFAVIADISEATISAWLAEQRAQEMSLQTSNYYGVAVKGFCRWLLRDRRTGDNPLVHLSGMNSQTDQRVERRSLPDEEFARLVATTRQQPNFRDLDGGDRAILYLTAAYTGFRANELRSLTPASFDLNSDQSTVTVAAGYSKRRRKDTQPIRPDLAEALRE